MSYDMCSGYTVSCTLRHHGGRNDFSRERGVGKLPREELWFGCHPGGSCLLIEWGVQLRKPFIRLCKRPMNMPHFWVKFV